MTNIKAALLTLVLCGAAFAQYTPPASSGGGASLGYTLMLTAGAGANPVTNTTYFVGGCVASWIVSSTEGACRVYVPKAGTIKAVYLDFSVLTVLGSAETSTISVRLNNTTDTTISSSVTNSSTNDPFSNTALSIAVAAGDFIELKWVTPAWGTPPTGVRVTATVSIQ